VRGRQIPRYCDALFCASRACAGPRIQLWFRTQQARRSQFRLRHSSRIATLAEAFSSIAWAGTAALAAAGLWFALFPALTAISILGGIWLIRPPDTQGYIAQ
jgi:ABC-2 type transport system permease protein